MKKMKTPVIPPLFNPAAVKDEFGNECTTIMGISTYRILDSNMKPERREPNSDESEYFYNKRDYFKELHKRGIIDYTRLFEELL